MNIIQEIRDLIMKGNLPEVLDKISQICTANPNLQGVLDQIIRQSSRFYHIEGLLNKGVIDYSNSMLERNKITEAILDILRQIEEIGLSIIQSKNVSYSSSSSGEELKDFEIRFVSNSSSKFIEYSNILSSFRVKHSRVEIEKIQIMNLESLVRKKIEFVNNIFEDIPYFLEHTELTIQGWNGLPGGMTKYFLESVGCEGICKMLKSYSIKDKQATARTMIGLKIEGQVKFFSGSINGKIIDSPRAGDSDFGWDTIFIPKGYRKTFSELGVQNKNLISMRNIAAIKMKNYLLEFHSE